jgi:hypothetical protein
MGAALRFSRGHEVMAHAERRRTDRYPHDLKLAAKCLDVHGRRCQPTPALFSFD